jgi:hypothetical protein
MQPSVSSGGGRTENATRNISATSSRSTTGVTHVLASFVIDAAGTLRVLEVKVVHDPNGAAGGETNAKAIGLASWAADHNKRRNTDPTVVESPTVDTGEGVSSK